MQPALTNLPSLEEAKAFLGQAQRMNPGPWVQHTRYVAQAAQALARHHPDLDPHTASILGVLHDIGRRAGAADLRHVLDGYVFLKTKGFIDAARICITHAFPTKEVTADSGHWDGTAEELDLVKNYLAKLEFGPYDRLMQLCDAVSTPSGYGLIEKRLLNAAMRHGVDAYSVPRWEAYLAIQQDFEQAMGQSIYQVLPGVVANTFGFDPSA